MRGRLVALGILLAGCTPDAFGLGDGGSVGGTTRGDEPSSEGGSTRGSTSSGAVEGDGGSSTSGAGTGSTSSGTGEGSSTSDTTGDVPRLLCPSQVELVGCYDFAGVGEGMLWDRSGNGNDAAAVGVGVVPGPFGDAATFDDGSEIAVPDSASLDITGSLTLEAWIMVDALPPPSNRFGVLDKEGQYSFIVYDTDEYRCDIAPGTLFAGPVVLGEWTHVACVYDGAELRAYVNGTEIGMVGASGPLNTNDVAPMALGDTSPAFTEPLDGAIGGVRVWSRALDAAELCDAAGAACSG